MRYRQAVWLLLAGVLAACAGGSGSSGFDISGSENAAIARALGTQQCVAEGGLTICPANQTAAGAAATPTPTFTPVPSGAPGAATPTAGPVQSETATPGGMPRIDTSVQAGALLSCAPVAGSNDCSFAVGFVPEGFPFGVQFRLAVRADASGPWRIGAAAQPGGSTSTGPFVFNGTVSVALGAAPVEVAPVGEPVELAVLVFPAPAPLVPAAVDTLGASGAAFAFVTGEITVRAGVP